MAQFARPNSTNSAGSWTPINASTLHEAIDEVSYSETDAAECPQDTNSTFNVGLSSVTDPLSSSGHTIRVRAGKGSLGEQNRTLTVLLKQGTTTITSWTVSTNLSHISATYTYTLTGTEADNITNYGDLRLEFTTSGTLSTAWEVYVYWAEFEVPDSGTTWELAGSLAGSAVVAGDLSKVTIWELAGSLAGSATVSGDLTRIGATHELAGSLTGSLTTSGDLTRIGATHELAGALSGSMKVSPPTQARPTSTTSSGSWVAVGAATLHGAINEVTPSESEYARCPGNVNSTFKVALGSLSDPNSENAHVIRVRASKSDPGSDTRTLTAYLIEGASTVRATWTVSSNLPASATDYEYTLSAAEAVSISDYTALSLEFTSGGTLTSGDRDVHVYWTEFEIPGPARLSVQSTLAATRTGTASTFADLNTAITLFAARVGSAAVTAALTTAIAMAAARTGTATVVAPLTSAIPFAAARTGTASTTAALTTGITLAASRTGTATVTASISLVHLLAGNLTGSLVVSPPTKTRPTSTTTSGSWTAVGAATLHGAINEVVASDLEYAECPASANSTFKVALESVSDPNSDNAHVIRVRASKSDPGGDTRTLTAYLIEGASTVRATWTVSSNLPASPNDFTYTLSAAEAASISSYSSLSLEFTAGGAVSNDRKVLVYWAEFETPSPAELRVGSTLAASRTGTATITLADLATAIPIASAVSGTASTTANLTITITFAAGVTGTAATSGALTTAIPLAASRTGAATVTATLSIVAQLNVGVLGEAFVVANLSTPDVFDAAVSGSATVNANLTVAIQLQAALTGSAATSADLDLAARLVASLQGRAFVGATISGGPAEFQVALTGSGFVSAALEIAARFVSAVTGTLVVGADLTAFVPMEADLTSVGSLSGTLIVSVLMASTGAIDTPEIWSTYEANSGTRLGWLPYLVSYVETHRLDGNDSLRLRYPVNAPQASLLTQGAVVRTVFTDGAFTEWWIAKVLRQVGNPIMDVECASIRRELLHSLIDQTDADGFVYFDVPVIQLTPTNIITNVILKNAPSWIVTGTVTPSSRLDMNFSNDTSGSGLTRLEEVTGYEAELLPNGTTQYDLNLVRRGAAATNLQLRSGRNLRQLQEEAGHDRVTVVTGYGGNGATLAWAYWLVTNVSASDVTLAAIHGGDGPILENDQLNNLYLEKKDGSKTQITDSVASTQIVTVASATGIAANDWVRIVKDSSGTHLTELSSPSAVTAAGTLRGKFETAWDDTTNILRNGVPVSWPGANPDDWTVVGGVWSKETGANNFLFADQSLKGTSVTSSHSVTLSRSWLVTARENVYSASVWVRPTTITPGSGQGIKFTALGQTLYYVSPVNAWVLLKIENVTVTAGQPTLSAALSADAGSSWTGYIAGFQINKGPIARPITQGSNSARVWQGCNLFLSQQSGEYVSYSGTLVDFEAAGLAGEQLVLGQTVDVDTSELGSFSARLVAMELDRLNPNNSRINLSTLPPIASRQLAGPPDLNVPYFEPIDLQSVRRDKVITALYIKADITATTATTVTILLDVRDSLGLSPIISYAAFGASYVSGSGAGPYVFDRPAVGAGVGRVVFTARLQGRQDVTDAVDVPESLPTAATPVIVTKADILDPSPNGATKMKVRVSAASEVAGTVTFNYTTNVTLDKAGGLTANLLGDIDDTPGAGEYVDYTIDRPPFGSEAGRVQFRAVAVGYVGGTVNVDVPAQDQDTDTLALTIRATQTTITDADITYRVAVADPDPPGGASVSVAHTTNGTVDLTSPQTITPETSLDGAANYKDYVVNRPLDTDDPVTVTWTATDTTNGRTPAAVTVEIKPTSGPDFSEFKSEEVSATQWKITWTAVGTVTASKNGGAFVDPSTLTPAITSGVAFARPAYGDGEDVYTFRAAKSGRSVVNTTNVPDVKQLTVSLTLQAAVENTTPGDVDFEWSGTGMPTGTTYDLDWEFFNSSNQPTGAKGYVEGATSIYTANPSPAFNAGDKYKYTIIAYDGNGVVIKTKSRSGTVLF